MATHPSVEAGPMDNANYVSETDNIVEASTVEDRTDVQLFRTVSKVRDLAPIAYMPPALAEKRKGRNLRRILTREQGQALELIGHAVDYLNDCYLYEGDEGELINICGSSSEAIQILFSMRWQILQSASLQEPWTLRFWNALFRRRSDRESHRTGDRTSQSKPAAVLPLSSSR